MIAVALPLASLLILLTALVASPAWAADCGDAASLPAPYDALARGEAALAADLLPDALAALGSAAALPVGPAARRRLLLLGQAHILSGDLDRGRATLNQALEAWNAEPRGRRGSACDGDPAEMRWWLAEGAVRRGQPEEAVPVWRALWTTHPLSARSDAVEALLRAHDPAFAADEQTLVLGRAAGFGGINRHGEALTLLLARLEGDTEPNRQTLFRAYFRARKYQEAITLFPQLQAATDVDRFDYALARSRLGDYDGAARVYGGLADGRGGKIADDASFKLGYLLYDSGRLEEGLEAFAAHLARVPDSTHAVEARWFMGWSLLKLDRLEEAQAAFEALLAQHGDSSLAAGAAYWTARIAGMQGDAAAERAGYESVLSRYGATSYAWWASGRLDRGYPSPSAPDPVAPDGGLVDDPALARGLALLSAGVPDWAAAEFRQLKSRARKAGREASLHLGARLAEAGLWSEAVQLAQPWCGAPEKRADPAALQICWPRPEGAQVDASGLAVARHLPFAIMHAESAWQPRITSSAGARGIMQLMPKLAAAQAAVLHPGAVFDPETLYDPAVNVEYGLAELAELTRSLADTGVEPRLPLVIAAYNGGSEAVRRWLAEQPQPVEVDRWAEDISYSETRRYVRRVLGTLQVYRLLYGDP